jgi:glycosyltransferase involved in cell wall biosynthesis
MKLLIANSSHYPSGGDWVYTKIVKDSFIQNGHEVIDFAMQSEKNYPSDYARFFPSNIDYRKLNQKKNLISGFNVISRAVYSREAKKKINDLLDYKKPDVAQFHGIHHFLTPSIIGPLKKRNIPIVWRILDYKILCPSTYFLDNSGICESCKGRKFYCCALKKCKRNSIMASLVATFEAYLHYWMKFYEKIDFYSFQNEFMRRKFIEYGFDERKTGVFPNPFNTGNIETDYSDEGFILYFGRLSREKGLLTLLKAMKKLPDIILKIVGNGEEDEVLKKFATESGLSNVSFEGPVWGEELKPYLNKCRFAVLPSEWYEPSPYAVLQAFAAGKPVIASDVGGFPELVGKDDNGLLFEMNKDQDLAEKIQKLYGDRDLAVKLGENARSKVLREHSPAKHYNDLLNTYRRLINNRTKI